MVRSPKVACPGRLLRGLLFLSTFLVLLAFFLLSRLVSASTPYADDAQNAPGEPQASVTPTPTPSFTPFAECDLAWRVVTSPNPGGTDGNSYLYGVDALTVDDAWAAGSFSLDNEPRSMMQHWNGVEWTLSPSSVITESLTEGVSIVSADDVWAVGYQWRNGPDSTFAIHWNGIQWSEIPSPNPCYANTLRRVDASSANDVWAVGYSSGCQGTPVQTLILHWDGTQWSQIASPNPNSEDNRLWDVAVISSSDAWAVGLQDYSNVGRTLILHWDGTEWSIVPSPNVGYMQHLEGVSSSSSSDVWAVGDSNLGLLIVHWDGTQWSVVPGPDRLPGDYINAIYSVKAISTEDIWAVGYYSNRQGPVIDPGQPLTLHWDGNTWTSEYSHGPGLVGNSLSSVAATSGTDVWGAGEYWDGFGSPFHTLVERYSVAPDCSPTPTVTGTPPTRTPTLTRTPTSTSTSTPTYISTLTPTLSSSATATSTTLPTVCTLSFTDVPQDSTFYPYVHCLACLGIISGYADGTFRPGEQVSRGQLAKIVSNSAGFQEPPGEQMFEDVPPGSTFYDYIGRLAGRGYISGYPCGEEGEPCGPANRPYFRPSASATRGQISKIVSNAAGFGEPPGTQLFEDVPSGSTFYDYIQRLASRGVIAGYPCGGVGEPCGPASRPYFRPSASATRGQTSKIDASTFFSDFASEP